MYLVLSKDYFDDGNVVQVNKEKFNEFVEGLKGSVSDCKKFVRFEDEFSIYLKKLKRQLISNKEIQIIVFQ